MNKATRKAIENALKRCKSLSVCLNDWKINQIRMQQSELPSQQAGKKYSRDFARRTKEHQDGILFSYRFTQHMRDLYMYMCEL